MDRQTLLGIAKSFGTDSPSEGEWVLSLRSQYPYSQFLHVLAAKISKDLNLSSQQSDLQKAAVYSTDRSVLKGIMVEAFVKDSTAFQSTALQSEVEKQSPVIDSQQVVTPKKETPSEISRVIDHVDVAEAVMSDLKKLNQLKHNFELLFADNNALSQADTKHQAEVDSPTVGKSKKERIVELAKEISADEQPKPAKRRGKKEIAESPDHSILEEIKISKEEMALESERQRQQIEIINQFIKSQPSISNVKEKQPTVQTDLNSIKSGEFSDNIISETLVEILIKQGKKERAIEVLKKLIWKYPQKKAYFASRIEDLKK